MNAKYRVYRVAKQNHEEKKSQWIWRVRTQNIHFVEFCRRVFIEFGQDNESSSFEQKKTNQQ